MSIVYTQKLQDYLSSVSVTKCVAGIEPYYYDMVMDSEPVAFMGNAMVEEMSGISATSTSDPKIHVRKLFPETWLWFNKTIGYVEVAS